MAKREPDPRMLLLFETGNYEADQHWGAAIFHQTLCSIADHVYPAQALSMVSSTHVDNLK